MTVQDFDAHTQRDMIQHHVVAALAGIGDDRLVFKGGTLLRVCGPSRWATRKDWWKESSPRVIDCDNVTPFSPAAMMSAV